MRFKVHVIFLREYRLKTVFLKDILLSIYKYEFNVTDVIRSKHEYHFPFLH